MAEETILIHDNLLMGERKLQNGSRGDIPAMSDQIVHISQATRMLLMKHNRRGINWPTASVILGILLALIKIGTEIFRKIWSNL